MATIPGLTNSIDKRGILPKHPYRTYARRPLNKVNTLAVHHSLTKTGSAKAFASYHVNHHGWPGIGYHFVIEKNGTIVWCNDMDVKSYHVGNSNKTAIGVCLIGDFRYEEPTEEQIDALVRLSDWIIDDKDNAINGVENIKGHSEYPKYSWKSCPVIAMNLLRETIGTKMAPLEFIKKQEVKQYHIVKRGDTIWGIAHEHSDLRTKEILLLNPHINARRLRIGQKIKLY